MSAGQNVIEESLINELYSFDHERMKKMVDLVTVMPSEDSTHNRGHK